MSKYAPIAPYLANAPADRPKKDLSRKPGSQHVAACADPRFQQSLPTDRAWRFIGEGDGARLFVDDEGTEVLVPAMPYNQTTEMWVESYRWYAEANRGCATRKREMFRATAYDLEEARRYDTKADEFEAMAEAIAATGTPGYLFPDPRS